jgi:hypothetical protein
MKAYWEVEVQLHSFLTLALDGDEWSIRFMPWPLYHKAWESIRDSVTASGTDSVGYYELKQHKPWNDEMCSKLLDKRKQAKLQWLHNPKI